MFLLNNLIEMNIRVYFVFNRCSDVFYKNKFLIFSDQKEYQCELEWNYYSVWDKFFFYIFFNFVIFKIKYYRWQVFIYILNKDYRWYIFKYIKNKV